MKTDQDIPEATRRVRLWEQHLQSVLLALITAALIFAATSLVDAKALQATLVAQIAALSNQVARLEGSVSTVQANHVSRTEFMVHEQRLQTLEKRK